MNCLPQAALELISAYPSGAVDVRSAGEYERGGIPGFANFPILSDEERAAVGLAFRQQGQAAAIEVGTKLTALHREARVESWRKLAQESPHGFLLVTCWRGGLRSKFACEWLAGAGVETRRVEGGYQAMRRLLMQPLQAPPPLVVLSGLTGCGKTELLTSAAKARPDLPIVDLERLAGHRGSVFGALSNARPQPRQVWFENSLALRLRSIRGPVLIEDESPRIGQIFLPPALVAGKERAPRILIEEPLEKRARRIVRDYVEEPLATGVPPAQLFENLIAGVLRLRRSLGGALTKDIEASLQLAFRGEASHEHWVSTLLERYYDRAYRHALERTGASILFRGSWEACSEWLIDGRWEVSAKNPTV